MKSKLATWVLLFSSLMAATPVQACYYAICPSCLMAVGTWHNFVYQNGVYVPTPSSPMDIAYSSTLMAEVNMGTNTNGMCFTSIVKVNTIPTEVTYTTVCGGGPPTISVVSLWPMFTPPISSFLCPWTPSYVGEGNPAIFKVNTTFSGGGNTVVVSYWTPW